MRTHEIGSIGYIPDIFTYKTQTPRRATETSTKAGKVTPLPWCSDSWNPKIEDEKPRVMSSKEMERLRDANLKKMKEGKESHERIANQTGHDYLKTWDGGATAENEELVRVNKELAEKDQLIKELQEKVFSLESIKPNDTEFQTYTNLPNYEVFKALCDFLMNVCGGNLNYWRGARTGKHRRFSEVMQNKPGSERKLSFETEFFMVLVKLKTGDFNYEIAKKFGISPTTVSKIFTTWMNFLHQEMTYLFEMKCNWDDLDT